MSSSELVRFAPMCVAVAMLTACGGLQASREPIGAIPQAPSISIAAATYPIGYTTLYNFQGGGNGSPNTGLVYFKGLLYGTTPFEVYSVNTAGTETVLYTFKGSPNGQEPEASLTPFNGALYGTTLYGGKNRCGSAGNGCGTVFKITTSGKESVVYRFEGGRDGSSPYGELVAVDGKLYGTTAEEPAQLGTIFSLTASGKEKVLHHFTGKTDDGRFPMGNLVHYKGVIYGDTIYGGTHDLGTVFEFSPSGNERLLHSFSASEGEYPIGLALLNGTLYGATQSGGPNKRGTIFSLTTAGVFHIVHSFRGFPGRDGADPSAPPVVVSGILYGTTQGGGRADREGAVYELTTSGKETILHVFGPPPDGTYPVAPLTFVKDALYGPAASGGAYSAGTIYRLMERKPS